MSLKYRNKWGPKNDAFVKSHSRGKTKLDNSFKKRRADTNSTLKERRNKKYHPFKEYKDKTHINKSKNKQ